MSIDVEKSQKEIRSASEDSLHKYRRIKQKLNIDGYLPKNKEDFTKKMNEEIRFIKRISSVLDGMYQEESTLLKHRYLKGNGQTYDYVVRNKLGVSERTYYRIKADALTNFHYLAH